MIVDVHTHYIPDSLADDLRKRKSIPYIESQAEGKERFHMPANSILLNDDYFNMEERRTFMERNGVGHQILSFPGLFGVESLPVEDALPLVRKFNDDVSLISNKFPAFFSGLASLPLADMKSAIEEYRRARIELKLIGAILPVNAFLTVRHAERMTPLFDLAEKIGGHFFIHPGQRPDEFPRTPFRSSPQLFDDNIPARLALAVQHNCAACMITLLFSNFLDPFENVTLHVANLGGTLPMVIERMDQVNLTRTPDKILPSSLLNKIYVDCSSLGPKSIEIAASFYGTDKILFGTDCPIFSTEWSKNAVVNSNLSKENQNKIFQGNAR
ncbi:MAG: amidohydrolase family protein, partial [Pseudomonadota bacterium]|nr:amidohydrolase family protein [Pseudomonadota bacterium]